MLVHYHLNCSYRLYDRTSGSDFSSFFHHFPKTSESPDMSLDVYPSMATQGSCFCYLNRTCNGPVYQYISETYMRPNFFNTSEKQLNLTNVVPTVQMTRVANGAEPNTIYGTYPSLKSLNFQFSSLFQELTTEQPSTNCDFMESSRKMDRPKSTEIWRPFSPTPTNDFSVPEDLNRTNQIVIPFMSSRGKIEHSKTSLFKPVAKRDFRCRHCSSSFKSNAQLISHLRAHTGSKPFSCDYPSCPKTFARNEELTRHRRIHSGYKPHLCAACGKSFGRRDHLSKHAKTHLHAAEKRAYACDEAGCGHRYTRSDALARHRAAAHAIYRGKGEPRKRD